MTSQESQRGGGNTKTPPRKKYKHNRSRSWVYTLNNYTEDEIKAVNKLVSESQRYCFGFEKGLNGTPHIQGYVQFKNQRRFTALQKALPRAHWERAKGTPDENHKYCSKEGDYRANFTPKLTREDLKNLVVGEYANVLWKPWQQAVIDMVDSCTSTRTIHWIYEPSGNVGKTYLARFHVLRS